MMSDLRHAMDNGRLSLAYQPKMAIENGRIGDAEALIRWVEEDGNKIAPDEFIPLAEATRGHPRDHPVALLWPSPVC